MPSKAIIPCVCQHCEKSFLARQSDINRGRGQFCSTRCWYDSKTARVEARFWAKVQKSDGCWEWTAAKSPKGYGAFHPRRNESIVASRYSYELHFGPIPDGLCVLHSCDNPPCVRPDHLFLGTKADNVRDMFQKGRQPTRDCVGEKNSRARLTETDVRAVRERYRQGGVTYSELAREYGMNPVSMRSAIIGRNWKHV